MPCRISSSFDMRMGAHIHLFIQSTLKKDFFQKSKKPFSPIPMRGLGLQFQVCNSISVAWAGVCKQTHTQTHRHTTNTGRVRRVQVTNKCAASTGWWLMAFQLTHTTITGRMLSHQMVHRASRGAPTSAARFARRTGWWLMAFQLAKRQQ